MRFLVLLVAVTAAATAGAFAPARPPQPHRRRLRSAVTAAATLDGFLQSLSTVGTARAIVLRPGAEAILEATIDLSTTSVKATDMHPSGKTLVTVASPDKSFELHLDAGRSAKATLGTSAKTGGPVCRVLDEEGTALATLVFKGDRAEAFESLKAELGEEVVFDGVA